MLIGYMRVSGNDERQSVALQRDALIAAGECLPQPGERNINETSWLAKKKQILFHCSPNPDFMIKISVILI
ncbi:hypothetical protein DP761_23160 [Salmonella enterica subsp. enterica]|nr:hypothetical protein [Salmonella enterica subsp. enterica serovar Reading]MLO25867.1 hypothetical protein [Salmonella enterica subsp. enterica serovar Reading]